MRKWGDSSTVRLRGGVRGWSMCGVLNQPAWLHSARAACRGLTTTTSDAVPARTVPPLSPSAGMDVVYARHTVRAHTTVHGRSRAPRLCLMCGGRGVHTTTTRARYYEARRHINQLLLKSHKFPGSSRATPELCEGM